MTGTRFLWSQISAQKNWRIKERMGIQLRWDLQNPFHNYNWNNPTLTVNYRDPALFGKLTGDQCTASFGGQPLMNLTLQVTWWPLVPGSAGAVFVVANLGAPYGAQFSLADLGRTPPKPGSDHFIVVRLLILNVLTFLRNYDLIRDNDSSIPTQLAHDARQKVPTP